eukprot:TRINITY_DN2108_c0_g3_i1.p1 TRINITY_DN2108_c0_g3~~TRINITY_DN2108_c0_g3_i1.p1  ORF type:complete len:581 (-),score=92.12 TRINITY_DN2108_c0_g3_i1:43-1785(-)
MRCCRFLSLKFVLLGFAFLQPGNGSRFAHVNDPKSRSLSFIHKRSKRSLSRSHLGAPMQTLRAGSDDLALIPEPLEVVVRGEEAPLKLAKKGRVVVEASSQQDADALFEHVLKKADVELGHGAELPQIKLSLNANARLKGEAGRREEAYNLEVSGSDKRVLIEAANSHGLFNGIMTLRQLLTQEDDGHVTIPSVAISDSPAKEWRGLMLDVSRHFFTAADVKKLLRTMALFKMNRFHWHLTDDQGWRVPIDRYPKLTEVGAWRKGTQLGHDGESHDNERYGGHYTKQEIIDVVRFANSLHIEVIPETDLPGHSKAAIASYPELGNPNFVQMEPPEVETQFGAFKWTMTPSDYTNHFIADVVSEVSDLVKSPYYHVGGDEVPVDQWRDSPQVQSFVAGKLPDVSVDTLAAYFHDVAIGHVKKLGRRAIVWDEALSAGRDVPAGSIAMLWRSWEDVRHLSMLARSQSVSVVMCPQDRTYLDAWQDTSHDKYDAIGGFTPLEKTYAMSLDGAGADVLGAQAQLWSEYIRGGLPNLEYMAWPRGIAMAELTWSDTRRPPYHVFHKKLETRKRDLDELGVNYHPI